MNKNNIFWGLAFIAAALILLFDEFNIFSVYNIALGILIIVIAIRGLIHRNFYIFMFSLALFCIVYDLMEPWPLLGAALLGSIGLSMIFEKKPSYQYEKTTDFKRHFEKTEYETTENEIYSNTRFGSSIKYVNSISLTKANISCSFGSSKIYFDAAKLKDGYAEIIVDAAFGCIELFIPSDWEIKQSVDVALGTVDIKGKPYPLSSNVIHLSGNVSFGSVIIHLV